MNFSLTKCGIALAALTALSSQAATVDLTGKGWTTYGDGNAYSLAASGLHVNASTGNIAGDVKLGLQSDGQLGNGITGVDDAFDTTSANTIGGFRMNSANEPGGSSALSNWDRIGWWDARLDAINSALDLMKNSIVFFFANNETGGNISPNLAAWSRVEVTQISTGDVLKRYDLTNMGGGYGTPIAPGVLGEGAPLGGGVVLGNVLHYTSDGLEPGLNDFLRSGNDVCVYINTGLPTACPTSPDPAIKRYVNNLGANEAAYAVVFPELDAYIAGLATGGGLTDFAIHVDFRLGCGPEGDFPGTTTQHGNNDPIFECSDIYAINGGAEKVFLGTQLRDQQVPEPGSLALIGMGLLGLAIARRRTSLRKH